MAWVAVNQNNTEWLQEEEPAILRKNTIDGFLWEWVSMCSTIELPIGSIEKLIGKKLTWEDEAVES